MRPAWFGGVVFGGILLYVAVFGLTIPGISGVSLTGTVNLNTWQRAGTFSGLLVTGATSASVTNMPRSSADSLYNLGYSPINDFSVSFQGTLTTSDTSNVAYSTLCLFGLSQGQTSGNLLNGLAVFFWRTGTANEPYNVKYTQHTTFTALADHNYICFLTYDGLDDKGYDELLFGPVYQNTAYSISISRSTSSPSTVACGVGGFTGSIDNTPISTLHLSPTIGGFANALCMFGANDQNWMLYPVASGTISQLTFGGGSQGTTGTLTVHTQQNGNPLGNIAFTYGGTQATTDSSGTWTGTVTAGPYHIAQVSSYQGMNAAPADVTVVAGQTTPAYLNFVQGSPTTGIMTIYSTYNGAQFTGQSFSYSGTSSGNGVTGTGVTVPIGSYHITTGSYSGLSANAIDVQVSASGGSGTLVFGSGGTTPPPSFDINKIINNPTVRAGFFLFGMALTGISLIMAFTSGKKFIVIPGGTG